MFAPWKLIGLMPIGSRERPIAIIADTISDPWGGSEELWSQTASRLVAGGVSVAISIHVRLSLHDRVKELINSGVKVWLRSERYPLLTRVRHRVLSPGKSDVLIEIENFLNVVQPQLVILSTGWILPPIGCLELCRDKGLPFVTIGQANSEYWWFDDETAARYRRTLASALRCFFVSKANLRLAEKQISGELSNAEVVRNPFNVNYRTLLPWPAPSQNGEIRFACVGRLDPPSKGQDVLLEALAIPAWLNRPWHLTVYG